MPTTTLPVRHVALPSRTEWHAASCGCRVPAGAVVAEAEHTAEDVAEIHAEAIDLNDGPSPIKPCLRRAAGIAR